MMMARSAIACTACILLPLAAASQTFPLDYISKSRGSWDRRPDTAMVDPVMDSVMRAMTGKGFAETMVFNSERATLEEVEQLRKLMSLAGHDIDSVGSFGFAEETNMEAGWPPPTNKRIVVMIGRTVHGFSFDMLNDTVPQPCPTCIPDTSQHAPTDAWAFIVRLLLQRNVDELVRLAKAEMAANDLSVPPTRQYRIYAYDRRRAPTIEHIFLHETVLGVKD